jgi:hypothetical protein
VQERSKADLEADLLSLRYAHEEVDEVRLHHVFEHFRRPTAYALLASWHSWLKPEGLLRIEVPDFDRTSRHILKPLARSRRRHVGLRHIFGSNEAPWAVHYEGWSSRRLAAAARSFGFATVSMRRNRWKGTYNVDLTARKLPGELSRIELDQRARSLLGAYLIDESPSELDLLELWMTEFDEQLTRTCAVNE